MKLYDHNKNVYTSIVNAIDEGCHSICYVMGTGMGKSSIFMKLSKEMFRDKKILYIVPKRSIATGIMSYEGYDEIADRVDFNTFNVFGMQSKKTKVSVLSKYDVVFIDEAHHLGSPIYGVNLLKQLQELLPEGKYMIGLTATPKRSCDSLDITDYFERVVYGLSTFDGIKEGILSPIEYYICDTESFAKAKDQNCKLVIDYNSSEDLLCDMVNDFNRNKWLWFCKSIDDLNKLLPLIERLFPGYAIFPIHSKSKLSLEEVQEQLQYVRKAVIVSVDMLLEGVHLDDFEGVILSRNVQSAIVLQQILGRVCTAKKRNNPVVIDCTKTAYKVFQSLIRESFDHRMCNVFDNTKKVTYKMPVDVRQNPILVYRSLASYKYYNIANLLSCLSTGKFVYKDTVYNNVKECCYDLGAPYNKVLKIIKEQQVSPQVAIDMYFEELLERPYKHYGVTFPSLKYALEYFDVSCEEVLKNARDLKVPLPLVVDYTRGYKHLGFYIYGQHYVSYSDCLREYNIPVGSLDYTSYVSFFNQLDTILRYRKDATFYYKGVTYNHLRDCCRAYGLSHKYVKRVSRNTELTAVEVLDLLTNKPTY